MNRRWDNLDRNDVTHFFNLLLWEHAAEPTPSVVRLTFHPKRLRPHIANWEAVTEALIRDVQREFVGGVIDAKTSAFDPGGRGAVFEALTRRGARCCR